MRLLPAIKNVCRCTHSLFSLKNGLNATQIKLIAAVFMTIDHISVYGGADLNIISGRFDIYRSLGRIAFPLFLYISVNGMHHTKNKFGFILRLYIANLIISIFNTFMNLCFKDFLGIYSHFEILSSICLTLAYIFLIENIFKYIKTDVLKLSLNIIVMCVITFIPQLIFTHGFVDNTIGVFVKNPVVFSEIRNIVQSVFPNVWVVPYSPIFIILGVLWYFFDNRILQAVFLCLFSLFSYIGIYYATNWNMFLDFFSHNQCMMILAVPFILMYNRQKGKGMKWFFYVYYPLHIYVIMFLRVYLLM